jgi:hypothetical protein
MSFTKASKEQHLVEYIYKDLDGEVVETEVRNDLLDSKSDMEVSLTNFKMYIS